MSMVYRGEERVLFVTCSSDLGEEFPLEVPEITIKALPRSILSKSPWASVGYLERCTL